MNLPFTHGIKARTLDQSTRVIRTSTHPVLVGIAEPQHKRMPRNSTDVYWITCKGGPDDYCVEAANRVKDPPCISTRLLLSSYFFIHRLKEFRRI